VRVRERSRDALHRGVVAVWTAISLTALLGFAALSIDVGYLYMVKAQLQVTADAAALAAAEELGDVTNGNPESQAVQMATEYAAKNKVLNEPPQLDPATDVTFGQAVLNSQTGRYDFVPNGAVTDAVRVRVRRTQDSPSGPVPLFFAGIFGKTQKDMWAEATAILIPRDIAIVADLSASHNDDSELRHINDTDVNLYDVWTALPMPKGNNGVGNGIDPPPPGNPTVNDGDGTEPGNPGNQGGNDDPGADPTKGPIWGNMNDFGSYIKIGSKRLLNASYDPTTDPGLIYLPRYENWSNAGIEDFLRDRNYNEDEIAAIMSATHDDTSSTWKARVFIALGIMQWRSGMAPDGNGTPAKWEAEGLDPGNGNDWVSWSTEVETLVLYPYPGGSWSEYADYLKGWSYMTSDGDPAFKNRFGVKTFLNYLLEKQPGYDECPDLYVTPAQPMQAVKDAVGEMMTIISDHETDDQVSLEVYGETARHEIDLTYDYSQIATRLNDMQAGHYDIWSNMGGGIERAVEELTGDRARPAAVKVIVLLTDGKANVTEWGATGDYTNGPIYALAAAQEAADLGIRIYCVSVGADADTSTMEQIAAAGHGTHFHAVGSIEEYSAQLQAIFETLGGKRPVMLID